MRWRPLPATAVSPGPVRRARRRRGGGSRAGSAAPSSRALAASSSSAPALTRWSTASGRAERSDLDVHRKGDELLIKVGGYKRNVLLPQALQPLEISAANLRGGTLVVRFAAREGPSAGARAPDASGDRRSAHAR